MSNFVQEFLKGRIGSSKGIPFGEGLENLTRDTNGIHKGRMYGIAGAEKSGKSTLTDYAFIIQPYLYSLKYNIHITWIYYSFEINRISKEFDFITYFLHYDFNITTINLPKGITRNGKNYIVLCSDYLRGYLIDDNGNSIIVEESLIPKIKHCYEERIIPLFGEYDKNGFQISKGLITFITKRENPTGVYKSLLDIAEKEGKILNDSNNFPISYKPNREGYKIVIVDHVRKIRLERGYTLKMAIDKLSEYMVYLGNLLDYVFVPIIHTNRDLGNIDRLKFFKGDIYPTASTVKDSGNLAEDCNYLLTIFNPNDDQYSLTNHFGRKIKDGKGSLLYPNLRSIHLVAGRHGRFPLHYFVNMIGELKKFEKIK